jgi:hypothetical protein
VPLLHRVERLLAEHAAGALAVPLSALLRSAAYDRAVALEIEAIARDGAAAWPLRRIAALMLETSLSRIRPRSDDERRFWIERLGMTDAAELALEGYAATEPLTRQVWRRLARYRRIHRLALPARRSDRAFRDFLAAAGRECRLTFARHLFSIDDIVARIERSVRRSTGLPDLGRYGNFGAESEQARARLPAMERALVEHFTRDGTIRWAGPRTPQTINALVEQPIKTVVLTVKPPGSSHEIEIKRAGRARELPLDVVWVRNDWIVPSSHHLDGGAMHQLLTFEAENSSFLSRVFREVHGVDAPMSRTLYLARIHGVPTRNGEADLLDYFTSRRIFGEHFDDMRWHMRGAVKTLTDYAHEQHQQHPNDLSLTVNFLGRVKPAQAIQLGTTSFRLDVVERYLQRRGAERYFEEGLKIAHTPDDDRRFADEVLDEALGEYEPPRVAWRSHAQYVEAAFRVRANRERANRVYVSLLEQVGTFWGTLLGIRGHTLGESFVARNAGLRSVWENGEWKVRMIFMDHDSLSFASVGINTFRPKNSIHNAAKDAKYVLGGCFNGKHKVRGELSYLRDIYRATPAVQRRGTAAFRLAMKRAYHLTHERMRTNPDLARLFRAPFVEKVRDWDDLVGSYLKVEKSQAARDAWKAAHRERLTIRGYQPDVADEYVTTVTNQAKFLRRVSFLF